MPLPPFQTLLERYGADVHRLLRASVGVDDADDCYQETWIAALRAYPRLRHDENLRGWLLTIASRKAIDWARARKRAPVAVGDLGERALDLGSTAALRGESDVQWSGSDPRRGEPDADRVEPDAELWEAVRRLPPKQRTAIALRYALDADYALIAQTMAISEDAARRNVHEGLKRLRTEYTR